MVSSSKQNSTKQLGQLLLDWYAQNARSLPWREQVDAYSIWVSEIMLQQTRVDTVLPYFARWMKTFPTLRDLANADEQQVLNLWEGLGYYSRARSMLKTARLVCEKYCGVLPKTSAELITLPGIGRYTAAAISSMAYAADEAVVDGNVKRVLARIFQLEDPVNSPEGEKRIWTLAEKLLPRGKAGDYNQAVMDLGATICTPKSPKCPDCPARLQCRTNLHGLQNQYPHMLEKLPIPHLTVCAAVLHKNGQVLIARRPSRGLLGGLWEFPGGKLEKEETFEEALIREICEELSVQIVPEKLLGIYHHTYTHFKVTLHAFHARLITGEPVALEASELRWVDIADLSNFPMGKIDRNISRDLMVQAQSDCREP